MSFMSIHNKTILTVVIVALLLRVAATLFLHYGLSTEKEFLDEGTYDRASWKLATHWRTHDNFALEEGYKTLRKAYLYWLAALYYLFGHHILIPRLVNTVVGALLVLLIYRLALFFTDRRGALLASLLYAVWPSCIFWGSLNLKLVWIVLLTLMSMASFFSLFKQFSFARALVLLGSLLLLYHFQTYSTGLLVFLYLTILLFVQPLYKHVSLKRVVYAGIGFCIFLILFYYVAHPFFAFVNVRDFTWLSVWRDKMTVDDSAFMKGVDLSTPLHIVRFLPVGLSYFFFAPFPSNVINHRLLVAFLENIVWYPLFTVGVIGIVVVLRQKERSVCALLTFFYCLAMASGFALMEGNIGSFFRHRFQVVPVYFMFVGAGISWCIERYKNYISPASKSHMNSNTGPRNLTRKVLNVPT